MNLEQLTRRAECIFLGTCRTVLNSPDPALGLTVTRVTFDVERVLKGEIDHCFTFRQGYFQSMDQPSLVELPRYSEGEEAVLFLWEADTSCMTSPVGLGQGRFAVHTDELGRRTVSNGRRNEGLFEGFTPQAKQWVGDALYAATQGDRLLLEELLDLVRALGQRGGGKGLFRPTLALV